MHARDQRTATENVRCWCITIYEKTQKTSWGVAGGGGVEKCKFKIEFFTQCTQQITSKGKQNKTKESVLKRTSKIVLNF